MQKMIMKNETDIRDSAGSADPGHRAVRPGCSICGRERPDLVLCSVPLIGSNLEKLGARFIGMTEAFDKTLQEEAQRIGRENNIPVYNGIYLQVAGPQFETPAEIRMYRMLGADTVGMSSAVEVIAARHMGMRVFELNCISNMAAGIEGGEDFDSISIEHNVENMEKILPS